jgi:hypothetical protein
VCLFLLIEEYLVRAYSVAITALAIGAPQKWVDNVLSHFPVPQVDMERRGVARRIPHPALLQLALTRELHTGFAMSVRDALMLAGELLAIGDGSVHRGGHVRVTCDRAALELVVRDRLRDALEFAPAPRRGRPGNPTRGERSAEDLD